MKKRNFLRYTFFNRGIIIKFIVLGTVKWLAVAGAWYMHWPMIAWSLVIVYAVFCALFFALGYRDWRKYKGK